MPPAGQAAKNPARENLGRDIVVRISRYNRPESIAAGDGHPLARYRCDTEGLLLNRPCIGRILFVVAHHLFPTCLQLISLSLGLDDNGLRAAASGPVETAFVRAVIFNASGQQRTVGDIYFRRTADIEQVRACSIRIHSATSALRVLRSYPLRSHIPSRYIESDPMSSDQPVHD